MSKTCFVVMPIGDQSYGDISLSASELRKRYDDLARFTYGLLARIINHGQRPWY